MFFKPIGIPALETCFERDVLKIRPYFGSIHLVQIGLTLFTKQCHSPQINLVK